MMPNVQLTYAICYRDGPPVLAFLQAPGAERSGVLRFEGPKALVDLVSRWLAVQPGRFGHLIGDRTTPVELADVMRRHAVGDFHCRLAEGDEAAYGVPRPR